MQTTQAEALASAERVADRSGMPQTIFRNAHSCGWWHTNPLSRLLTSADIFVTLLPKRYFQR